MKRLVLAVALLAVAPLAFAQTHGSWTASRQGDKIQLRVARDKGSISDQYTLSELGGLTASQIDSATPAQVSFAVRGDAGTVSFTGTFQKADGAGRWEFEPNRAYLDALASRQINILERDRDQMSLVACALRDVSLAYIDEMIGEGYRPPLQEFLAMRVLGVNSGYVRELRTLGYDNIASGQLIAMRAQGIDAAFIEKMNAASR